MILHTKYAGRSGVSRGLQDTSLRFATNQLREATYFRGVLANPLPLREALAALYHVVVSDQKYRPRDRLEFRAWLEEQDRKFLSTLGLKDSDVLKQMERLELRLSELDAARHQRRKPFYNARRNYFEQAYRDEYEINLLLDPVITVHPDELSFEAFSRDESTYARVAVGAGEFAEIREMECGTTNIDFSIGLHRDLERMRSYRQTEFTLDPQGFGLATFTDGPVGDHLHREKKIDLPESWVRGFLQVHTMMSLSLTHVRLAPVDLYNIIRLLCQKKAKKSPRSLRWELQEGQRPRVVIEPWNTAIDGTSPWRSQATLSQPIRTWGRDRLKVLGRLLPLCRWVDVFLAGYGLPSFYVLQLDSLTFTLGLSGWTDNDWTEGGTAGFDVLTRRSSISAAQIIQAYQKLQTRRVGSAADLAQDTGLAEETCRTAVSHLCQAGKAMIDLVTGNFRHRDLFLSPLTEKDAARLVSAGEDDTPAAKTARTIFQSGNALLIARRPVSTGWKFSGSVKGTDDKRVRPLLHVDQDSKIIEATCTCQHFKSHKLTKGPCEHMLALRLAHIARIEQESQST